MTCKSTIELRDLKLLTKIDTYKSGDVIPDEHRLDMTPWINSRLVLIGKDSMAEVFDYDPLVVEVDKLVKATPHQTHEMINGLIAKVFASYPQIEAAEIALRKTPVLSGTGTLGIRIYLDLETLMSLR